MPKPISPQTRRKIIDFDPHDPKSPSITEFCKGLKISTYSFYNIRSRAEQEGAAALHPLPPVPKNPRRVFGDDTTRILLTIRSRLKDSGWDYGPMSIWFAGIESGELQPPVPSVSTIARLLRHAGAVESNPRKRPKSSYLRFQRGKAMELWQLDGLKYHLYDQQSTVITIYQLIDDATRKDMGTSAYPSNENSADALDVVTRAIAHYGAPNELLTDNASAFNQLRQGKVGPLEEYVASQGCKPIPGRPGHPQTQGKNERSHTTLIRFLDAHRPTTLEQAKELITTYREHYNTRRAHQGLGKPAMTPEQAWELMEHAEPQPPLDPSYLAAVAAKYRRQRQQAVTTDPIVNTGEKPAPNKGQKYRRAKQAELDQATNADDGADTGEDLPYGVEITRQNPAVFFRGRRISVPTKYSGKFYIRNVTEDELTYWDADNGELIMRFPLPLIGISDSPRFINSYNIKGAWLKDPPAHWQRKHAAAEKRFANQSTDQQPGT